MSYNKILKDLYSLDSPKFKLGLENLKLLLDKIGNPQDELTCVHVAGTNGKGSVCAMIYAVLSEAGYQVGLYTSPHLKKFNERIRINDRLISDKDIVSYYLKIKPHLTNQSFFEITTAMALLYFKEKNVDFVVLEVGLGGRLDATNVVNPLVSVITNISLEHTDILGKTVEKIAFEKAGIIKNNVPVVTGAKGKVLKVIREVAKEKNAPLFLTKRHKKINFKNLSGAFQQENKDIAFTALKILKKYYPIKINQKQIIDGIKKTKWPGRLQFISKNTLVDVAHNPAGFEVLKKELLIIKTKKDIRNFIFVVGIQNNKDISAMLKIIIPIVSKIIFTKSRNEKAAKPSNLLNIFNRINKNKSIKTKIIQNPKKALNYAKKIAGKNDLIVATGSIYMVGGIL